MASETKSAKVAPSTKKDAHSSNGNGKAINLENGVDSVRAKPLKADIGIAEKNCKAVIQLLNQVLANESVLATKTKNYHWNVVGIHFNDLHKFFESQYQILSEVVDLVAERTRKLGGNPLGNMAQFIQHATLTEENRDRLDAHTMLRSLLADHEAVIKQLRQYIDETDSKYEDAGTADFLTGIMEGHELSAWQIRSMCE